MVSAVIMDLDIGKAFAFLRENFVSPILVTALLAVIGNRLMVEDDCLSVACLRGSHLQVFLSNGLPIVKSKHGAGQEKEKTGKNITDEHGPPRYWKMNNPDFYARGYTNA